MIDYFLKRCACKSVRALTVVQTIILGTRTYAPAGTRPPVCESCGKEWRRWKQEVIDAA